MSETSERLRQALNQLHAELESIDRVDPEVEGLLREAVDDIHAAMASSTEETPPDQPADESIGQRLSEVARHFEESHPTFAGTLGKLVDLLGQMGI